MYTHQYFPKRLSNLSHGPKLEQICVIQCSVPLNFASFASKNAQTSWVEVSKKLAQACYSGLQLPVWAYFASSLVKSGLLSQLSLNKAAGKNASKNYHVGLHTKAFVEGCHGYMTTKAFNTPLLAV